MIFKNGMTVRDLKILLNRTPEYDDYGEPFEVWIGDGRVSNHVKEFHILNKRVSGSDILLIGG